MCSLFWQPPVSDRAAIQAAPPGTVFRFGTPFLGQWDYVKHPDGRLLPVVGGLTSIPRVRRKPEGAA